MKTQKIITLAVLLSVCSGFATAHIVEGVAKAATKKYPVVRLGAKPTPTQQVLRMTGLSKSIPSLEKQISKAAQAAQHIPAIEGMEIRNITLNEYSPADDYPMPAVQELLEQQYLRELQMAPRWNPEIGKWETTDGQGNIVDWNTLSPEERQVRWAQADTRLPLDLTSPAVEGTQSLYNQVLEGMKFYIGENYKSFLEKCDFYFYHPQWQQWMLHHADGTTTVKSIGLERGETFIETLQMSEEYVSGKILIPNMSNKTVLVFSGYEFLGEKPAPEWMQPVFKKGYVSTMLHID